MRYFLYLSGGVKKLEIYIRNVPWKMLAVVRRYSGINHSRWIGRAWEKGKLLTAVNMVDIAWARQIIRITCLNVNISAQVHTDKHPLCVE